MMIERMFAEMVNALGYNAWYECEEEWEGMAEVMVAAGIDEDEVTLFFSEMAMDL